MKRELKKIGAILLAVCFILTLATACGSENGNTNTPGSSGAAGTTQNVQSTSAGEDNTPLKLGLYIGDTWDTQIVDPSWTDPVAQKITELTGISFDVTMSKSDNPDQEISIMMASDEIPDVVFKMGDSQKKLISGGYVQPLDDLIDKYGPTIKQKLGTFLDDWRAEDGKLYNLGSWGWTKPCKAGLDLQPSTLYMRYDILKELGYSKLDRQNERDGFITWDEYMQLLKQVKDKYPDMIPVLMGQSSGYDVLLRSFGKQVFGDGIYTDGKDEYYWNNRYSPEILKFMNGLYAGGYVPKGFATMTLEQNQNNISNGKVFSTLGMIDGLRESQIPLSEKNDERRMVMFYLIKDPSVQNVWITWCFSTGSTSAMISSKTQYTERIIKFFDWCLTEDASWLLNAGVDGVTYNKDSSGKRVPIDDFYKGYSVWDVNVLKKYGAATWVNIFPSLAGVDETGNAYDICAQKTFEENKWTQYNNIGWKYHGYVNIVSPYYGQISQTKQQDAFEAKSKIEAYIHDIIVKPIIAKDAQECQAEWDKILNQMKSDGLDKIEPAVEQNWSDMAKAYKRSPDAVVLTVQQALQ